MAKRGPKQKLIEPERVEELARKGYQQVEIAAQLGISNDTYFKRINENSEISVAYKKGRDTFLEYIRKTRTERVLEALDQLIMERHPAAVIFASKTILGLQETITHNHTANGQPLANAERLRELEEKRKALLASTTTIDVESEKE